MYKIEEAYIVSLYKNKVRTRVQCGWEFNPHVCLSTDVKITKNVNIKCPKCNTSIYPDGCETCYEYCEYDFIEHVVKVMKTFEIDLIEMKEVENIKFYKHNIGNFYCLTMFGVNLEQNELSLCPHDIYFYYTLVFTDVEERDREYDNTEIFEEYFGYNVQYFLNG